VEECGNGQRRLLMKVKTLICNCKGLDPFRYADMNSLAFEIESEFDVSYAAVHPQLCAEGGNQILEDVLSAAEDDPDTYVLVCACAEETQLKLFKKVLRNAEFNTEHFVPLDIRNTTNDGILDRIRERLKELADPNKPRH
jgi:heterodisulfide reductase subunit A-like polyferredoxin